MTTAAADLPVLNRGARFSGILDPSHLFSLSAAIIGVGAGGHALALELAALGLGSLTLIDHDTIEDINLAPQKWSPSDLTRPKVDAARDECLRLNPACTITTHATRFTNRIKLPPLIFMMVDSLDTRAFIARTCAPALRAGSTLFDCRMAAETCEAYRILATDLPRYLSSIVPDSAVPQLPCTSRTTPYCASLNAALCVSLLSHHLRDPSYCPYMVRLSLPAWTLDTLWPTPAPTTPDPTP